MDRRFLLGCFAWAAVACGGPGPEDWPEDRPLVEELSFLSQKPQSPETLAFALTFRDSGGDLGGGRMELRIEGVSQNSLPLTEVFAAQRPPVPSNATEGWFEFFVELERQLQGGERVEISVELIDAGGRRSNKPSLVLEARKAQSGS